MRREKKKKMDQKLYSSTNLEERKNLEKREEKKE
jgi:hypothetical protein